MSRQNQFTLAEIEDLDFDHVLQNFRLEYDSEKSEIDDDYESSDDEAPILAELTPVKYPDGALGLIKDHAKNAATRDLFGAGDVRPLYFAPDGAGPSRAPPGAEPPTAPIGVVAPDLVIDSRNHLNVLPDAGDARPNYTASDNGEADALIAQPNAGPTLAVASVGIVAPGLVNNVAPQSSGLSDPDAPISSESEDDIPLNIRYKNLDGIWDERRRRTHVKPFRERVGPEVPDTCVTPTDHFLLLLTEDFINEIVFQTNLYAVQNQTPFQPTNSTEIKCFLAANIMMGITKKPSYHDYWSSNIQLRDDYVSSLINMKRFSWLLRNIHMNDNSKMLPQTDPNRDKLFKLRPLIEVLSRTFREHYHPMRQQSADEGMVKFKGRSSLKQYLPKKPIKRGFKIWVRADMTGYVSQFQVYTGKSDQPELGLGERVVVDLTRDLVGKNYQVYCDNYFTSIRLLKRLLEEGIYACGTVQKGRKGLPNIIAKGKQKRGSCVSRSSYKGLFYTQWEDNKTVRVLSNFHDSTDMGVAQRKNRAGEIENVPCPKMILDYNMHMGGVDKSDMLRSYYCIDRKSRKWWHRLLWYFIDVCVCNAYILFHQKEEYEGPRMKMKDFRLAVVSGLVGARLPTPKGPRRTVVPAKRQLYLKKIPLEMRLDKAAHLPTSCSRRRCAYCSRKGHQKRTNSKCTLCDVPLCIKNCFQKFHT